MQYTDRYMALLYHSSPFTLEAAASNLNERSHDGRRRSENVTQPVADEFYTVVQKHPRPALYFE